MRNRLSLRLLASVTVYASLISGILMSQSCVPFNFDEGASVVSDDNAQVEIQEIKNSTTKASYRWENANTLEDRLKLSDIPNEAAFAMPADELVTALIEYPLNYLFIAYNNPQDAIEIVVKNSAAHRALLCNREAVASLLERYDRSTIDFGIDENSDSSDTISYVSTLFLEYLLASDSMKTILEDFREQLVAIVSKKVSERLADPEIFSYYSIKPLVDMNESLDLGLDIEFVTYTKVGGNLIGYTTVYTPLNHHQIQCPVYTELGDQERGAIMSDLYSNYRNVEVLAPATYRYNCHSYAWYDQSPASNNFWIPAWDSNYAYQLDKFWTDDLYEETTVNSDPLIAYYRAGDHSARIVSSSEYISKWGAWPLIRHTPSDCPYSVANMHYYKKRTSVPVENSIVFSGPAYVTVNANNRFDIPIKSGRTYVWSVEYMNAPTMPNTYELIDYGPNANEFRRLICKQEGAFLLRVDEYLDGLHTAFGQQIVIAYEN